MDNTENIFHLEVDQTAKAYMVETARWAKFLAILTFIMMGILVLASKFIGDYMALQYSTQGLQMPEWFSTVIMVVYILVVCLYFYPVFALLKFSNLIKPAVQAANKEQFNNAFRYLKNMFKYIGILTIIFLSFYGIAIIFAVIGIAMR